MFHPQALWDAIISGEGILLAAYFVFAIIVAWIISGDNEHNNP